MDSSEIFFKLASQAMAELSSGVIYIMVPSNTQGTDWWYNSLWNLIKWSNIGPAVTQVIRVNPDTDHQETIKGGMPARSQRRHVQHHHQRRRRRHHRQNYHAVAKAGVGVDVRVDSRWRLIEGGKLIQLSIAPSHRAEFD